MGNNQLDQPKRPWRRLAWFIVIGFVAGACTGTIINDVAGIHGATLWCTPIGIGLGLLVGILLPHTRKQ
jgi:hypothetical protein